MPRLRPSTEVCESDFAKAPKLKRHQLKNQSLSIVTYPVKEEKEEKGVKEVKEVKEMQEVKEVKEEDEEGFYFGFSPLSVESSDAWARPAYIR